MAVGRPPVGGRKRGGRAGRAVPFPRRSPPKAPRVLCASLLITGGARRPRPPTDGRHHAPNQRPGPFRPIRPAARPLPAVERRLRMTPSPYEKGRPQKEESRELWIRVWPSAFAPRLGRREMVGRREAEQQPQTRAFQEIDPQRTQAESIDGAQLLEAPIDRKGGRRMENGERMGLLAVWMRLLRACCVLTGCLAFVSLAKAATARRRRRIIARERGNTHEGSRRVDRDRVRPNQGPNRSGTDRFRAPRWCFRGPDRWIGRASATDGSIAELSTARPPHTPDRKASRHPRPGASRPQPHETMGPPQARRW